MFSIVLLYHHPACFIPSKHVIKIGFGRRRGKWMVTDSEGGVVEEIIINPRHAHTGGVITVVLVCVCVAMLLLAPGSAGSSKIHTTQKNLVFQFCEFH